MCHSKPKKVIFQIGRLDKGFSENKTFKFGGKTYDYPLSSFAIKQHFGKDAKIVILYPVSLVLNESFKNYDGNDEFLQIVKNILNINTEKEKYLKNPYNTFCQHPHSQQNSYEVIHSLGTYAQQTFSTTLHDLILYIWCIMMQEYIENEFEEIYIDISSGLNFYVTSLQEALRYFLTWENLYNISSSKLKGFICYTDPILGSAQSFYTVYTYESKYKIFFKSPIDSKNYNTISKYIIEDFLKEDKKYKKRLNNLLENFFIIFSSIENAAPLTLFTAKLFESNAINHNGNIYNTLCENSKEELKTLSKFTIEKFRSNWITSPQANFDNFSKIFFSLALLHGLVKFLNVSRFNLCEYVTLETIENFADEIESKLGLKVQSGLIKNELYNNFKHGDFEEKYSKNNPENEWINLADLLKYDNIQRDPNIRNFFAHAGFEKTMTQVKKENGQIVVKYKDDDKTINKIKEFLLKRVEGK